MKHVTKAAIGTGALAGITAALAAFSRTQARLAEQAVPADGGFIEVAGARLHYVDRGSGPAIVLIHGLGGQMRNFGYGVVDALARDHRVIAIDRPRSGYSTANAGTEPGIVEQAAIIARAIMALGLDRPLVVGHSLGGALALALALDHPHAVRALALIAPLTMPEKDVPRVFRRLQTRFRATRFVVAHVLGVPLARLAGGATTAAIFAPEAVPGDFGVRGGGQLALRPANISAVSFELTSAGEEMDGIAARYGELTLPIAILYARGDAVLDADRHGREAAQAMPTARLELVNGGHMLPVTQPDRVATFIAKAAARAFD